MSKKINILSSCILLLGLVSNTSAGVQSDNPTHLDDNFESYTNDSTMLASVRWNNGPRTGAVINGVTVRNPQEVALSISLSLDEGFRGSQAIQMDVVVDSGAAPRVENLGENWDPCIYAIMGTYTPTADRIDLTDYAGIRLWIKPGTITGDRNVIFKINVIESSTLGGDKWMGPKVYVDYLDPAGQFVYFDFDDFYEYYTASGQDMDRTSIKISFLFLSYDYEVTEKSTATIWVDDITVVHKDLIDDFEVYASDTELQEVYEWSGAMQGNGTTTVSLDTAGGSGVSQAMKVEFNYSSGDTDPWNYAGGSINQGKPVDWSGFDGLRVWLKANESGDAQQNLQLAFVEGDTTSGADWGDKWHSADIMVSDLDPNGEYVFLSFEDFVDYGGYGGSKDDGVMDATDARSIFIFGKYSGTLSQNSTTTVLVDDIIPAEAPPDLPADLIDDFERYESDSDLQSAYPSVGAIVGDSVNISLDATGSVGGGKAMKIESYFSMPDSAPFLYAGGPVRSEIRNWSQYGSITVWIKATESGDSPQYLDIALHEGDSTADWGDRFKTDSVLIKDIDPNGEYFKFAFSDFSRYGGNGGPKDNGILDLVDIRNIYVRIHFDGEATQNSKATIWVDDITLTDSISVSVVKDLPDIPEKFTLHQNFPNPFNPVTTIQYELSHTSDVKLIIYDILGREIIRLVDDRKNAGPYSAVWNGKDQFGKEAAAGVYIYRLTTQDFAKTKKLVLIK